MSGAAAGHRQSQRDRHVRLIREEGRTGRQKVTGYGRRGLVETGIGRCKALIGPRLRARTFGNRRGEVAVAVEALDRMIRAARPSLLRVA